MSQPRPHQQRCRWASAGETGSAKHLGRVTRDWPTYPRWPLLQGLLQCW